MELGALICLPGQPICARCPVESRCAARQQGLTGSLPIREPRKKPLEQTRIVAVIERRGKILIRQRPPKGLLARMWEFPGWDHDKGGDALSRIAERLSARGLRIESADQIGDSRHVFTHRVWLMRGMACASREYGSPGREALGFAQNSGTILSGGDAVLSRLGGTIHSLIPSMIIENVLGIQ